MGRISRRRIDPEVEERIFEIFWDYFSHLNNPIDVKEFLKSLLSYTEQVMLSKRLAIVVLLSKGLTYENISDTLKVSKSTIGSVHKQLFVDAVGYSKAIRYISSKSSKDKLINKADELFISFSPPKAKGSIAWQSKSRQGKKIAKRSRQLSKL